MKKLLSLTLIITFALLLASCGTAMPTPPADSPLIGSWEYGYSDDVHLAYVFNADGTGELHLRTGIYPIRWSVSGHVLRMCDHPDECSRRRCSDPIIWDFMFDEYGYLVLSDRNDEHFAFIYRRRNPSQDGNTND